MKKLLFIVTILTVMAKESRNTIEPKTGAKVIAIIFLSLLSITLYVYN